MIFSRTQRFRTNLPISEIRERLINQRLQVHQMDFEVFERQQMIKVIPHAENTTGLKTLPITHIEMRGEGEGQTRIKIFSKPRKVDIGGPYMIVIFCICCVIGAALLYLSNTKGNALPSIVLIGVGVIVFALFWFRMEVGYFDYIRKIRAFVHKRLTAVA